MKKGFYIVCSKCSNSLLYGLLIAETSETFIDTDSEDTQFTNAVVYQVLTKYELSRWIEGHINSSCVVLDRSSPFSVEVRDMT